MFPPMFPLPRFGQIAQNGQDGLQSAMSEGGRILSDVIMFPMKVLVDPLTKMESQAMPEGMPAIPSAQSIPILPTPQGMQTVIPVMDIETAEGMQEVPTGAPPIVVPLGTQNLPPLPTGQKWKVRTDTAPPVGADVAGPSEGKSRIFIGGQDPRQRSRILYMN